MEGVLLMSFFRDFISIHIRTRTARTSFYRFNWHIFFFFYGFLATSSTPSPLLPSNDNPANYIIQLKWMSVFICSLKIVIFWGLLKIIQKESFVIEPRLGDEDTNIMTRFLSGCLMEGLGGGWLGVTFNSSAIIISACQIELKRRRGRI